MGIQNTMTAEKNRKKTEDIIKQILSNAKSLSNPLEGLESYTQFNISDQSFGGIEGYPELICISKNNLIQSIDPKSFRKVKIQFYHAPLPRSIHNACITLFCENMTLLYKHSSWGLNLKKKELEFRDINARFLIVSPVENVDKVLAFSHFRFEMNDNEHPTQAILYIYEIQVSKYIRRRGVGHKIMTMMELVGMRCQIKKVFLTVFKTNELAMKFYTKKMKYNVDECSPRNFQGCNLDYEIMSKWVGRGN